MNTGDITIEKANGMSEEKLHELGILALYTRVTNMQHKLLSCDNKWLRVAFHLAFTATLRIGELRGLTWDCVDISEEAIQGDSGHAQADMVTEVYGHILDEDRRKNAELIESAFYNKENLSPNMHGQEPKSKAVSVPDGVDAELLMKVLENPEMAALLTSLAKTMKV